MRSSAIYNIGCFVMIVGITIMASTILWSMFMWGNVPPLDSLLLSLCGIAGGVCVCVIGLLIAMDGDG